MGYCLWVPKEEAASFPSSLGRICCGFFDFLTHTFWVWQLSHKDVYMSYLPLAHIFDRVIEECFISHGASIGFWRGVSELLKSSLAMICSWGIRSNLFITGREIVDWGHRGAKTNYFLCCSSCAGENLLRYFFCTWYRFRKEPLHGIDNSQFYVVWSCPIMRVSSFYLWMSFYIRIVVIVIFFFYDQMHVSCQVWLRGYLLGASSRVNCLTLPIHSKFSIFSPKA